MNVGSRVEVGHICWPTRPTEQSRCDINMTNALVTHMLKYNTNNTKNGDMKQYHRFLQSCKDSHRLVVQNRKLQFYTNESSVHDSLSSDPNSTFMITHLATMMIPT